MATVNISLITDYDSGVHADTDAVDAMSVLEVFKMNSENIKKVVLGLVGRLPADLDALRPLDALKFSRGDGHAMHAEDIRLFDLLD